MQHPAHLSRVDSLTVDVVVVGAGPSGCGAAYDLALKGVRVLLLDRTPFPRRKVCAGGLTIKAVRALAYSIDPIIHRRIDSIAVSCRWRHPTLLMSRDPICYTVDRWAFDHFCWQQTLSAGVRFAVIQGIDRIVAGDRSVSVVTNQGVIRCLFLIGADGVHSRVRQLTGTLLPLFTGFAVEGIVNRSPRRRIGLVFDFNRVKSGYGWVFPKNDHFNVGLYTMRPDVRITREDLMAYSGGRIGGPLPKHIRGYPLGMGGWRYRLRGGRVLLIGDAAGLVDPILGEGLYHAILSGRMAAAAIADDLNTGQDAAASYAKRLKPIQRDLFLSRLAAVVFYTFPRLGYRMLTSGAAGIPLIEGFANGLTFADILLRGYRSWFVRPTTARIHRHQDYRFDSRP